jgi:hypothetical protein
MIEFPLFAQNQTRILKYDIVRLKSALKNGNNSLEKFKSNSARKSKLETIKYLLNKESITWDFCLFSSLKTKRFLKKVNEIKLKSDYSFHPFVLIGHPKDFYYPDAIFCLIENGLKYDVEFLTLTEMVHQVKLIYEKLNCDEKAEYK